MNPIFLSSLAAFFHKVKCPKCERDQFISRGNSKKSFRCKFCGYAIELPSNK
jgi:ribosomal protein S27E